MLIFNHLGAGSQLAVIPDWSVTGPSPSQIIHLKEQLFYVRELDWSTSWNNLFTSQFSENEAAREQTLLLGTNMIGSLQKDDLREFITYLLTEQMYPRIPWTNSYCSDETLYNMIK